MLADTKFGDFFKRKVLHFQNGFACGDWNDAGRGIVQLRPFNINENGEIDLAATKFVEPEQDLTPYLLKVNDVVFNNTNSEALVGKTALWTRDQRAVLSNHMTIVRVLSEDGISPQFVAFYLLKKWMDGYFRQVCRRHVNQASVSIERLKDTPFPDFDVDEQRRIAHILNTVQTAIEQQARLIALTQELKRALMRKLFTEGLRGEKQKMTEIGLVPESWEVVPLGDLARIGNGSTPKRTNEGYWREGTIPWLTSSKVHEGIITHADEFVTELAIGECHLPRVKAGSLLIAITGQGKTLGNSALVTFESCVSQHLAYAQFTSSDALPGFILRFVQSRYRHLRAISQAGGSTKGALTCGYLKTFQVPLPCGEEQKEISDAFEVLERKISVVEKKRNALQDLFRTLLHQLMTGKVRIHELELGSLE